jgi:hypothetical protein
MTAHAASQVPVKPPKPGALVPGSSDIMRLATLVASAFEAGSRKAERDVLDEICNDYGLSLDKLEQSATRGLGAALRPNRRIQLVRAAVGGALAGKAGTVEALASTVFRRTKGFIAMLDEIYGCLAKAEATTSGNSETFRLRVADVDIPFQLSPAFFERVRKLIKTLTTIEVGNIDADKLSRFLGVDGDFYGSWPLKSDTATNVARQLTYLPWLVQHRGSFTDRRGMLNDQLDSCAAAATSFVTNALRLVRAYVTLLREEEIESKENNEPETDSESNDSRGERWIFNDRLSLKDRGILRGGLRPRTMGLRPTENNGFIHVVIEDLFSASDTMGVAPNCIVALNSDIYPDFYGSPVGALACLCGLWKAGIQREPSDSELSKLIGHPDGLTAWIASLETALRGASEWLANEIWTPAGTLDRMDVVEVFDDYLQLPLWRYRWLIYEIWLIALSLEAINRAGWHSRLTLTNGNGSAKTWMLPKAQASAPCATINIPGQPGADLHLWYQGRWKRAGVDMMPDVALTTTITPIRDIIVVEGKDRYRMPIKSLRKGALEVGQKYSQASGAAFTWIVNCSPFATTKGVGSTMNHGDAWHGLFLAEVRPGQVPQEFLDSFVVALQPVTLRITSVKRTPAGNMSLVFVCDTTGSMQKHLKQFWQTMRDVLLRDAGMSYFGAFRAVLFGDHDPAHSEPYLVREVGPALQPDWVIDQAMREPGTSGGDIPEALEDAIKACRDVARRLGQPICCIVATDAPPHTITECPHHIDFGAEMDGFLGDGNICMLATNWLTSDAASAWKRFEKNPRFFRFDLDDHEYLLKLMKSVGLLVM